MAAKIGILGETTTVPSAGAVTTLYTVPSSKAARVRILWMVLGGGTQQRFNIEMGMPSNLHQIHMTIDANQDSWSGLQDITANRMLVSDIGTWVEDGGLGGSLLDHQNYEFACTLFPVDYYLSTGDTVDFLFESAVPTAIIIQVHGVEDDA